MLDILNPRFPARCSCWISGGCGYFPVSPGSGENGEAERFWNAQKPQQQMVGADVTRLHILFPAQPAAMPAWRFGVKRSNGCIKR